MPRWPNELVAYSQLDVDATRRLHEQLAEMYAPDLYYENRVDVQGIVHRCASERELVGPYEAICGSRFRYVLLFTRAPVSCIACLAEDRRG